MRQLWITGIGIISAIGVGKEETRDSLLASRSGIDLIQYLKTEHTEFPVGEVKLSNEQMIHRLGVPSGTPMTRTALMGMLALNEALNEARLDKESLCDVGFVSGTTVGGMDKSEQYYHDFFVNDMYSMYIKTHDCGACTEMIADYFGKFAFITTLSTACSSAANAIIYGARMIENGQAPVVVVGGSECLTKFHLNGFNSLRILDEAKCRPFDTNRAGLNLGEGAAFLVLETPEHAQQRGVHPISVLAGYGNACDAYHQTASSPNGEGAFRAMQEALREGGIKPNEVNYINAHGTGTPNNDVSESEAMRRIFSNTIPPVSSTKAFTGHTTSASGSIEAVICIIAMQEGFIPPNLHSTKFEDCITPVCQIQKGVKLKYVLCNSFGFGGNDSSILLAKPEIVIKAREIKKSHKPIYVYASQQISIQQPLSDKWMTIPEEYNEEYNRAIEPNYKFFIPPMEARRMGKLLKRALTVSKCAIEQSKIQIPDAVITGTGLGCIENTELFLDAMCKEGEYLLKPTYFMQSTHNTISSLLSISLGCHGYNATYSHKNISFDSALSDAFLQLTSGKIHTAMVGGFDEMTPSYFRLLKKAGYLGQEGEISGESAISVILGHYIEGIRPLCQFQGIRILHLPSLGQLRHAIDNLLSEANLTLNDLSGILVGINGSGKSCQSYYSNYKELFGNIPMLHYKHLFGESYTASAQAFYVAASCLSKNNIPEQLFVNQSDVRCHGPQSILLYNHDDDKNHTLTLLNI